MSRDRTKKREKRKPAPAILGVGTVSVIFILFLLCMVTFALLSYSSAASDERLSTKAAQHSQAYYAASKAAQERIGVIDDLLEAQYSQSPSEETYLVKTKSMLETADYIKEVDGEITRQEEALLISWQESIDEEQALYVCLRVVWPEGQECYYKIVQYQTKSVTSWSGDTSVPVYGADGG